MDEHFRAFSFVNRITSVQAGVHIRGSFKIPPGLAEFPMSLVGEAVGQLAAWAAIAAVNFERRPVAGIAAMIEMLNPVSPGDELELAADLDSVDAGAVSYGGLASVRGLPVLRLHHCVGPMVPLADFDDPSALRERFAFLCAAGVTENVFPGVPPIVPQRLGGEAGQWVRAGIQVPSSAAFFGDHFPRRPVFPGTLLMHVNLQLVLDLAAGIPVTEGEGVWAISSVHDVKLRAFIPPGEALESEARLVEMSADGPVISLETRRGKRAIGTARVRLACRNHGVPTGVSQFPSSSP
jgi:3-hydroxymyristoyl/3-hydroxydecanoyl-(acyl carrier protein) dehydratase